VSCHAP